jgi:cytochrome c5
MLKCGKLLWLPGFWLAIGDKKIYMTDGFFRWIRVDCIREIIAVLVLIGLSFSLSGCVMSEEMRRISEVKKAQRQKAQEGSTNLNGEQIFFRSCNTCHPSGRQGMGPALDQLATHFPDDQALKAFIRKGKNMMPPQPPSVINDQELDNLVDYLRDLKFD